jgi:hypothetical protein
MERVKRYLFIWNVSMGNITLWQGFSRPGVDIAMANTNTNISKLVTCTLSNVNNLIIFSTLSEYGDMYI